MARQLYGTTGEDSLIGDPSQVNIFHNVGIGVDEAIGGKFNDAFFMQVDRFVDKVDGGAGEDTIDYSGADRGVNIDLSSGLVTANINGTSQTVTEVANVEDAVGSKFDDTINGTSGDNRLDGGAGNDTIHAGAGNDTLIGGTGANTLTAATAPTPLTTRRRSTVCLPISATARAPRSSTRSPRPTLRRTPWSRSRTSPGRRITTC